jgi:DNA-binding LytR/AlgR family response regulator
MEYQSKTNEYSFAHERQTAVADQFHHGLMTNIGTVKRSFLVFKQNKYMVVPTETIALFYIKHESTLILTMDKQEYSLNYSLDQIQHLVSGHQFFRLNRQHLINFNAVKEVEHYFARKLMVTPTIPSTEKLLVSKEKARSFLNWLENR